MNMWKLIIGLFFLTSICVLSVVGYKTYQDEIKERNKSSLTLSLRAMKIDPKHTITFVHKFDLNRELKKYKEVVSVIEDPCKTWFNSCSNYVMIVSYNKLEAK